MKKTLYYIDRQWYDSELNEEVGDMSFAFCDAGDTLTANFEELKKGVIENAPCEIEMSVEDYGEDYLSEDATTFPVYYIMKAEFELDEDDYDEEELNNIYNYTLSNMAKDSEPEVVFSCAYCTSKRAEKITESGYELKMDYYACDFIEK